MTITNNQSPTASSPQDKNSTPAHHPQGLEALVQSLAKRVFAEQAKELSVRAEAAEEHSRLLAERVALLEDNKGKTLNNNSKDGESDDESLTVAPSLVTDRSYPQLVESGDENRDDDDAHLLHQMRLNNQAVSSSIDEKETSLDNKYRLPESTFSLLITERPYSVPFAYAVFSIALSISCLCLTLASSVTKGSKFNRLGVPGGVTNIVRAAQFLGVLVGVLMEDEIPEGLQLIANGVRNKLLLNNLCPVQRKVVLSSILRLIVGYLFLSSLFINIAQNSDVIEIFYDVLALEFVENIDTTAFALAKRGFFGRSMLLATITKHTLEPPIGRRTSTLIRNSEHSSNRGQISSYAGSLVSNNRVNLFVKSIFFLNAVVVLTGMSYITVSQNNGNYRCTTMTVMFEEEIWEDAHVLLSNGDIEDRLLIYSNFNGIYKESGRHGGYPRYTEQNKNNGKPFQSTFPAEIRYCTEINSWVFMHPHILTSHTGEEENECNWLWKSPQTQDYDLLGSAEGAWSAWVGEVKPLAQVSIICNECKERSDCNYHGACNEEQMCVCDGLHFGDSCEFELPCPSLASEKAQKIDPEKGTVEWEQENPIRQIEGHMVYNRPVYIQKGLSGEPYDMRLYKILEPDSTPAPSSQPSDSPSISEGPTSIPSQLPSAIPSSYPTSLPSSSPTKTGSPTSTSRPTGTSFDTGRTWETYWSSKSGKGQKGQGGYGGGSYSSSKSSKDFTPNNYNTAPDFADWDDFFEGKPLHDLEDILDDYSVILSYSGSRFYGTIIEPDATFDELFPLEYHAFWSKSFNANRTFIISDTTTHSTPIGLDFYEMRRRINTFLNPNVQFSYSPFGAMIPLMSYEGAGFFHCLEETPRPSTSPSSSSLPTLTPSNGCTPIVVNILTDEYPDEISWTIYKVADINTAEENNLFTKRSERYSEGKSSYSQTVCLLEGEYKFAIKDYYGDGIELPGYYNITYYGELITAGGDFERSEVTSFSIPWNPVPSARPSLSSSPTVECWPTSVNIRLDLWPKDISWTIYKMAAANEIQGEKLFIKRSDEYQVKDAVSLKSSLLCLQEGNYQFAIFDSHGDGLQNTGFPPYRGYYNLASNGEIVFNGEWFRKSKTHSFSIPVLPKPSTIPSTSHTPSSSPSFVPTTTTPWPT